MAVESRWYQLAAIKSIFDYYESGKTGNPLIALPTGTGKSIVIARFIEQVLKSWPNQRIMMLTHVKELIIQNANKLKEVWPTAPLGIYSSGLKQRDTQHPIIFAGVASVHSRVIEFGHRDVLIIDEAHLLSPNDDSMYQKIIKEFTALAKELKKPPPIVVGLTATPFRMGQGLLTDSGLFTDITFDLTDVKGFNRLIAEGFLCPIYPKKTVNEIDVSGIKLVNGDFSNKELGERVDKKPLTHRILEELVYYGADRQFWLLFASSIEHSEHVAEMLRCEFEIASYSVHSKLSSTDRHERISNFKSGNIRCLVNNNVLTTGFDHPGIDLIGHLRPTMSPGLWVQMNGRGTRPSPETGKRDCLALDFAGNTKRLGPINDPIKPRKKGEAKGDAPVRVCEECGIYNAASARFCFACGHEFTFREKLQAIASESELIRTDAPVIETFDVKTVFYHLHQSKSNPNAKPCLKISYVVGLRAFFEWVHLDSPGLAGHKARNWWRERHAYEPPTPENCGGFKSATEAALSICGQLKVPKRIRVHVNKQYPEVIAVEY